MTRLLQAYGALSRTLAWYRDALFRLVKGYGIDSESRRDPITKQKWKFGRSRASAFMHGKLSRANSERFKHSLIRVRGPSPLPPGRPSSLSLVLVLYYVQPKRPSCHQVGAMQSVPFKNTTSAQAVTICLSGLMDRLPTIQLNLSLEYHRPCKLENRVLNGIYPDNDSIEKYTL